MFVIKHGTQHYLVYIIVLKGLEFKKLVICLKERAKLRFYGFLSVFGTLSHKVVQTWFVWHETWHKKLFDIYYYVKRVGIEKNIHILQITCLVAFLRF